MAGFSIFKKNSLRIAHLPTIGLLLGYLTYWFELYFLKIGKGKTSYLAPILFAIIAVIVIIKQKRSIYSFFEWLKKSWGKLNKLRKFYVFLGFLFVFITATLAFYASLLPPHLSQEFDVLNYHLTIPRQHLIAESFAHIRWSTADLFVLPIDFALSPYWFVTDLPNKIPQFFFFLGLVSIVAGIVKKISKNKFISSVIAVFAIFGSHFIGIQMGTAMLDVVICYLFVAALDSFLNNDFSLGMVEFTFFFWSKPFVPFQFCFLSIVMALLFILFKKIGFTNMVFGFSQMIPMPSKQESFKYIKKALLVFIVLTVIIACPFLLKSFYVAGTPLFPFFTNSIYANKDSSYQFKDSLDSASKSLLKTKDAYGHGRSLGDFLKHFWLIAVPEDGVNNKYDYPVGLMYLIFLGPFFYMLLFSILKKRIFPIIPIFIIVYWMSWWLGSQQTRFLYVPIVLMIIVVACEIRKPSIIFMIAAMIALSLCSLSVFRAHRQDFGLSKTAVLRPKDKELLRLNKLYSKTKDPKIGYLDYHDVAYANFSVIVTKRNKLWVIED